jgi:hypothetical protein
MTPPAGNQFVSELAGGAARPVCHGNEGRPERLQVADGLVKFFPRSGVARGEELKRQRWKRAGEDVSNVHGRRKRLCRQWLGV